MIVCPSYAKTTRREVLFVPDWKLAKIKRLCKTQQGICTAQLVRGFSLPEWNY